MPGAVKTKVVGCIPPTPTTQPPLFQFQSLAIDFRALGPNSRKRRRLFLCELGEMVAENRNDIIRPFVGLYRNLQDDR